MASIPGPLECRTRVAGWLAISTPSHLSNHPRRCPSSALTLDGQDPSISRYYGIAKVEKSYPFHFLLEGRAYDWSRYPDDCARLAGWEVKTAKAGPLAFTTCNQGARVEVRWHPGARAYRARRCIRDVSRWSLLIAKPPRSLSLTGVCVADGLMCAIPTPKDTGGVGASRPVFYGCL